MLLGTLWLGVTAMLTIVSLSEGWCNDLRVHVPGADTELANKKMPVETSKGGPLGR